LANNLTDTRISAIFEHGLDIKSRRVFLQYGIGDYGEPEGNIAVKVIRGLLYLDSTKKETDIELWINTPGGDVDDMFALYDIMQNCDNDVVTVGHGCVASAGALILAGGTKGKRYATASTTYMVHEFQGGVSDSGTRTQEVQLKVKKRLEETWAIMMGDKTTKPKKFWLDKIRKEPEYWLDSKGMLDHGVIDEIW